MKPNVKSSITLPASELRLVTALKERLGLKSNVDVVRRGLRLLREDTDRRALREAYRKASRSTRSGLASELEELDHLTGEGLD
jgi:Arc/MetJ-type ribon-helix-helix transcriptional regulator